MPSRSDYIPIQHAAQGLGGSQNSGIYIVRQRRTNVVCIEKRVPPVHINAGDTHREVRAMQQCMRHPNIVCILDYDLHHSRTGYGCIWMQHCELGSLDALILRLAQNRVYLPDEGFLWKVLWDITIALCYLSTGCDPLTTQENARAGRSVPRKPGWNYVIHHDLKPSNIFMTMRYPLGANRRSDFPTCLIGDFGCSVSLADIHSGQGGTRVLPLQDPAFNPPEAPSFDEKGDVYGIGLIIHCLALLQQVPTPSQTMRERAPLQNLYASEGLNTTISSCLIRDLRLRPSPQDLPMLVWRHYQAWRRSRHDGGQPLPGWAFNS
ncbi:kinase-like domain-containing protein [Pyrenochaeta sp. MPI-SDFR-AT-0127]|nr:kinase-like domain-containing protein [Pyrenochaeta sp. MPI-SDFR-AT-0127]